MAAVARGGAADAAAAILAAQPAPPSAAAPSEVRRALHTAETRHARGGGLIGGDRLEHEQARHSLTDAIQARRRTTEVEKEEGGGEEQGARG